MTYPAIYVIIPWVISITLVLAFSFLMFLVLKNHKKELQNQLNFMRKLNEHAAKTNNELEELKDKSKLQTAKLTKELGNSKKELEKYKDAVEKLTSLNKKLQADLNNKNSSNKNNSTELIEANKEIQLLKSKIKELENQKSSQPTSDNTDFNALIEQYKKILDVKENTLYDLKYTVDRTVDQLLKARGGTSCDYLNQTIEESIEMLNSAVKKADQ